MLGILDTGHKSCFWIGWQGYVVTLKEGYGFIRCTDRDSRMFFHYSELLDLEREVRLQQEVEFTVVQVFRVTRFSALCGLRGCKN